MNIGMQMQQQLASTAFHPKASKILELGRSSGLTHFKQLPIFYNSAFLFKTLFA